MKHWLLAAALVCFGSSAQALKVGSSSIDGTAIAPSTITVLGGGGVAVGTTPVSQAISVYSSNPTGRAAAIRVINGAVPASNLAHQLAVQVASAPYAAGQKLGAVSYGLPEGVTGANARTPVQVTAFATEAWTATAEGSRLLIEATPTGSATRAEKLRISGDGAISIGADTTQDAGLIVKSTSGANANAIFKDSSGSTIMKVPAATTGNFNLTSSSYVFADSGIATFGSQSGAVACINTNDKVYPTPTGTDNNGRIYWESTSLTTGEYSRQDMIDLTNSSGTMRARGAGTYSMGCCVTLSGTGISSGRVYVGNYALYSPAIALPTFTGTQTFCVSGRQKLADNAAVDCRIYGTGDITLDGNFAGNGCSFNRMWLHKDD